MQTAQWQGVRLFPIPNDFLHQKKKKKEISFAYWKSQRNAATEPEEIAYKPIATRERERERM